MDENTQPGINCCATKKSAIGAPSQSGSLHFPPSCFSYYYIWKKRENGSRLGVLMKKSERVHTYHVIKFPPTAPPYWRWENFPHTFSLSLSPAAQNSTLLNLAYPNVKPYSLDKAESFPWWSLSKGAILYLIHKCLMCVLKCIYCQRTLLSINGEELCS